MNQQVFNPASYTFKWVNDWYEWDSKSAHNHALKARNAEAKRLKAQGYRVSKCTLKNQLITKGGIGSGNPEISLVVNCYLLNATK